MHEYDRDYHKLLLNQISHLWKDKIWLILNFFLFLFFLSFLFLFLLLLEKDLPCTKVPLPLLKKGIKLYVQWLLLSRSLQPDSKYLKELECSLFFHNHLFSGNHQLLIYQHDFLVTWQNWGIIFLAALDLHIPGPVWWNVRISCHPNTMLLFQNNPFQPSFTNTF